MDICPNENLFSVSVTNTLANQTVCWQPSQEARCLGGVLLLLPGARLSPEATMERRGEGRASIPSKWPSCKISPVISVQRWMSPARPPPPTPLWVSARQEALRLPPHPSVGLSRALLALILHMERLPLWSELCFGCSVSRPCVHACVFLVYENKPFCFIISFPRTVSIFIYLCLYKYTYS